MPTTVNVVAFTAGIILIAYSAIGKGITIQKVVVPSLDRGARVSLFVFGLLLLLTGVLLNEGPGVTSRNEASFHNPIYRGERLDICRYLGVGCGQEAANAWCVLNGFSFAKTFDVEVDIGRTKTLGKDELCIDKKCSAFGNIVCVK